MKSIPEDKVEHFIAGCCIYVVVNVVMTLVFMDARAFFGYCMSAVVLAAISKEIYDYLHPQNHTCDIWDAVATIAGGLFAGLSMLGYVCP